MSSIEYAVAQIDRSPKQTMKHVLEFGVYKGDSIRNIRRNMDGSFKVFGFDTFEGLPEKWENTPCEKGFFTTDGVMPTVDGVKMFKGLFKDTIPEYMKEVSDIALIHVDCDLYSSTKDVLYGLNDYIKPNTIIVFDEWFYMSTDGYKYNSDHEQRCFYEWVVDKKRRFEFIEYIDHSTIGHEKKIVRITK